MFGRFKTMFWIWIHWFRNRSSILSWIPIWIQGFHDQEIEKKFQLKKNVIFFLSKIAIYRYFLLGLHKGCPSYRRSLQSSKKNIHHFKTWNFFDFFHFCPPGSGSGTIEFGYNTDPDPKHWCKIYRVKQALYVYGTLPVPLPCLFGSYRA